MKVLAGALNTLEGRAALERAASEVEWHGGTLHIVAFHPAPTAEESRRAMYVEPSQVNTNLKQTLGRYRDRSIECIGHEPRGFTRPSEAILHVAASERVDLIVIGMRQRSRVGKLVLGSNAHDILLRSPSPVLSVPVGEAIPAR